MGDSPWLLIYQRNHPDTEKDSIGLHADNISMFTAMGLLDRAAILLAANEGIVNTSLGADSYVKKAAGSRSWIFIHENNDINDTISVHYGNGRSTAVGLVMSSTELLFNLESKFDSLDNPTGNEKEDDNDLA